MATYTVNGKTINYNPDNRAQVSQMQQALRGQTAYNSATPVDNRAQASMGATFGIQQGQSGDIGAAKVAAANDALAGYIANPSIPTANTFNTAASGLATGPELRTPIARDAALDTTLASMQPAMADAQQRFPQLYQSPFGVGDALFLAATSAVGGAGLGGVLSGIGGLGTVGLTGATGAGSTMGGAAAYGAGAGLFGSGAQASMAGQDFTLKDALTGAGMGAITGALAHTATPAAPTAEFPSVTMPESSTILDNIASNATGNIAPEAGGLAWGTNVVSPAAATSLGMAPSMVDSVNTMNMAPAISAANRTAPSLFTSLKNAWDSAPAGTADTLMSLFGGDTPAPQTQQPTAMPSMMQPMATSALSSAFNPVGGMNQQAGYDQEAGGSGMFGNLNLGVNPDITF